jgi:hypothetical protein
VASRASSAPSSSNVGNVAPQRLRAFASGELWNILTEYYLRRALGGSRSERRESVIAVVAIAVDEIMAIDDIDSRDVYDDYED